MARQALNFGSGASDDGEFLSTAMPKVEANFVELYGLVLLTSTVGRLARYSSTAGVQAQTAGLYEDGSGNVGIGTVSPATAGGMSLDVAGQIRSSFLFAMYNTVSGRAANFGLANGYAYFYSLGADDIIFGVNNDLSTKAIRLNKDTGNLGVGTSSPAAKLHVAGAIRCASYTVATVPSASSNGAGSQIYVSDESGGATLAFSDGTDWRRVTDRAVIT